MALKIRKPVVLVKGYTEADRAVFDEAYAQIAGALA